MSDDAKPAHPPPWRWVQRKSFPGPADWCQQELVDADGKALIGVGSAEEERPWIDIDSPAVRLLTELSAEMEALLREGHNDDVAAKACSAQPGAVHRGLAAETCGRCWYCRVDALLARLDEARKARP